MSTNSKKPKTLSASSFTKLISKDATRAKSTENNSGTTRHTRKSSPNLNTVSDQRNVLSDNNVVAQDYIL